MSQSKKSPKKLPSLMIRVSQEAANRLEAETLRRSIKEGIVQARSSVLDSFILKHLPPADSPLMDIDKDQKGVEIEVDQETDNDGEKTS